LNLEHKTQISHAELAKQVQLSPNEISAIIGKPPKLIYMLGGSVIFMALLLLVIISFLIPYKETLPVKIRIVQVTDTAAMQQGGRSIVTGQASMQSAGLVRKGQPVLISLDAYPAASYGQLEGIVDSVLPFTQEQEATILIRLNKGTAGNAQAIPPQPLLTGNGNILIKEKKYFSQFFTF
jgi:hypothetical protein